MPAHSAQRPIRVLSGPSALQHHLHAESHPPAHELRAHVCNRPHVHNHTTAHYMGGALLPLTGVRTLHAHAAHTQARLETGALPISSQMMPDSNEVKPFTASDTGAKRLAAWQPHDGTRALAKRRPSHMKCSPAQNHVSQHVTQAAVAKRSPLLSTMRDASCQQSAYRCEPQRGDAP